MDLGQLDDRSKHHHCVTSHDNSKFGAADAHLPRGSGLWSLTSGTALQLVYQIHCLSELASSHDSRVNGRVSTSGGQNPCSIPKQPGRFLGDHPWSASNIAGPGGKASEYYRHPVRKVNGASGKRRQARVVLAPTPGNAPTSLPSATKRAGALSCSFKWLKAKPEDPEVSRPQRKCVRCRYYLL